MSTPGAGSVFGPEACLEQGVDAFSAGMHGERVCCFGSLRLSARDMAGFL
jgi:hypothetical protein